MYKYNDDSGNGVVMHSDGTTKKNYGAADENTKLIGEAYAAKLNKDLPKKQESAFGEPSKEPVVSTRKDRHA